MKESSILYALKALGFIIRCLPLTAALGLGRFIGVMGYYLDCKHRRQAYLNLRIALSGEKTPGELDIILKDLFKNYAQNFIEIFRMPSLTPERFKRLVKIEGEEHIVGSLKKGKGLILLAMHSGSWEMANLTCAMLGYPYKVIVNPQKKYSRLADLINSYRSCGGSVILTKGMGTRDFIKSLENNEVIGMVGDQGGKDGVLVSFLGRSAPFSNGAIRIGLKFEVPICFSVIIRKPNGHHHLIIHKPLELVNTGDLEKDIAANLNQISRQMEGYIRRDPSEYMWFYKAWKYSKEVNILLLTDGRTGHLRQSQMAANSLQKLLAEKGITAQIRFASAIFKDRRKAVLFSFLSLITFSLVYLRRWDLLKNFLTAESFKEISSAKAEFIISCGSSVAALNQVLSRDQNAKSIVIQKPGLLSLRRFNLVILPQHDTLNLKKYCKNNLITTHGAVNLIDSLYLKEQAQLLLNRFSHLKNRFRTRVGVFIGGDSRDMYLSESQIKIFVDQLKEVLEQMNADSLITTSRRTPPRIEQLLQRAFKKDSRCALFIDAAQNNVPEAVGGILGLADILIVSGDSISMVSEAASSGKPTIVFLPRLRRHFFKKDSKHKLFVENLHAQGFIFSTDMKGLARAIYDVSKNKIQTKPLEDRKIVEEALKRII